MIQLQFVVPPERWIDTLCRQHSATVKILSMKPPEGANQSKITHFVDILSEKTSATSIVRELGKLPDVVGTDVAVIGANRIVGAVTSNDCTVCSVIMESNLGYFIGPAVTGEDCKIIYKIFMSGDGIPRFLQALHVRGVDYKVSEISKLTPTRALTSKQEKVLKTALELGYYEYPKRASTDDLSKALGVATSTISEILRRAERKIISEYFGKDGDRHFS
jgi:predicted DNA binding protein